MRRGAEVQASAASIAIVRLRCPIRLLPREATWNSGHMIDPHAASFGVDAADVFEDHLFAEGCTDAPLAADGFCDGIELDGKAVPRFERAHESGGKIPHARCVTAKQSIGPDHADDDIIHHGIHALENFFAEAVRHRRVVGKEGPALAASLLTQVTRVVAIHVVLAVGGEHKGVDVELARLIRGVDVVGHVEAGMMPG